MLLVRRRTQGRERGGHTALGERLIGGRRRGGGVTAREPLDEHLALPRVAAHSSSLLAGELSGCVLFLFFATLQRKGRADISPGPSVGRSDVVHGSARGTNARHTSMTVSIG